MDRLLEDLSFLDQSCSEESWGDDLDIDLDEEENC